MYVLTLSQAGKTSAMTYREVAQLSGKSYKDTSKQIEVFYFTVTKIIQMYRRFKMVETFQE